MFEDQPQDKVGGTIFEDQSVDNVSGTMFEDQPQDKVGGVTFQDQPQDKVGGVILQTGAPSSRRLYGPHPTKFHLITAPLLTPRDSITLVKVAPLALLNSFRAGQRKSQPASGAGSPGSDKNT